MNAPNFDPGALRAYYAAVAPLMLPFVANRPLNLVRCSGRSCWFQRNLNHPPTDPGTFGAAVGRVPIKQKNGRTEEYLFVEEARGIEQAVAAAAVEFHGWGSRVPDVEKPDRLVIDLDPDEGLGFAAVRDAALIVRNALEQVDLKSFALLTGGKGVHVVVPLKPVAEWDEVRAFAFDFCKALAGLEPLRFTVALPKAERKGRVFLDYLRNGRTATAVLPYSARARPGFSVAAPVSWSELRQVETPARFTILDTYELRKRASARELRHWGAGCQTLPAIKSI